MYLNVQPCGLSGRPHQHRTPKKLQLHQKFLTCDYITNARISLTQPGISPTCSLCAGSDSNKHFLVSCMSTSNVRSRLFPELMNIVAKVQPFSCILVYNVPPHTLTLFSLDCASPNLPAICVHAQPRHLQNGKRLVLCNPQGKILLTTTNCQID